MSAMHPAAVLLWGLVASVCMATLLEGARLGGLSRMGLPFLFGTAFVAERRCATILGYTLYLVGGWAFAYLYAALLGSLGVHTLAAGALAGLVIGLAHGAFLVTLFLPLLALVHPRLAAEHDGPAALAKLEPPGRFGLNYGRATPLVTLAGQALFGAVFGLGYGATG